MSENTSELTLQPELKRLSLKLIRTSLQNPRLIITQDMIDTRAASMAEVGLIMPITVRPLSPSEIKPDNDAPYEIVDGEVRYRAALKLGWAEINTVIEAMSPRRAYRRRVGANRTNKPIWFEDYVSIEVLVNEPDGPEKMQKQEIAALFEVDNRVIGRALKILNVLSAPSRALVLENLQKFTPTQASVLENLQNGQSVKAVSENALYRLADLGNAQAVDTALPVVLGKQMTEPQTQELVKWVQAGNPAETHIVGPKAPRAPKGQKAPKPSTTNEMAPPATAHATTTETVAQSTSASPQVPSHSSAPKDKPTVSTADTGSSTGIGTTKASASAGGLSTGAMLGWDLLAGIPVAAQIRAKIKKGERPTWGEAFILLADFLYRGLHWLSKAGWKLGKWFTKALWKLFKESIKDMVRFLGPKVRKTVTFLFGLAILCGMIWGAWDIHEHGYLHPFKVVGSKVFSFWAPKPEPVAVSVTPVVTAVVPAPVTNVSQVSAVPTSEPIAVAPAQVVKAAPPAQVVAQPTTVKKGDAFDDLAGAVTKQAMPDAAANAAKKLFGL